MFTFLPRSDRGRIEKEYRKRVLSMAFVLGSSVALALAALAAPSYILMEARKTAAASVGETGTSLDSATKASLESRIGDIKAKVAALKAIESEKTMTSVIASVSARLSPGIALTGMSLTRGSDQGGIVISGTADTRDDLVAFTKSLQGEPSFKNVALPVSALAKSHDIGFSITIDSRF